MHIHNHYNSRNPSKQLVHIYTHFVRSAPLFWVRNCCRIIFICSTSFLSTSFFMYGRLLSMNSGWHHTRFPTTCTAGICTYTGIDKHDMYTLSGFHTGFPPTNNSMYIHIMIHSKRSYLSLDNNYLNFLGDMFIGRHA